MILIEGRVLNTPTILGGPGAERIFNERKKLQKLTALFIILAAKHMSYLIDKKFLILFKLIHVIYKTHRFGQ